MLANERLIIKMSIEQKVGLITSLTPYESSPDENYEFPVFKLTRNPLEDCAGVFATQFPSDKSLAASWNMPLVTEVYAKQGEEVAAVKKYPYFNLTDSIEREGISEDYYLTARTLFSKIKGLSRARVFTNFEEFPVRDDAQSVKNLQDSVLSGTTPRSVLVKSPEDIEVFKKQKDAGCLFFGVAKDASQALRYFLNGCTLVFLEEDVREELSDLLKKLTVGYRAAYADYRAEEISLSELDRRCQALEIFDEEIINSACDRLVSTLLEMRKRGQEVLPAKTCINTNHVSFFDEVANDALAITAARQSAVLLKNAGVLPLNETAKVAIIGDCAKEFNYQSEFFSGKATAERVPFYVVNNYEINAVGFASGYEKGTAGRRDLIEIAVDLAKEAEVSIVYLNAEKGEKKLPAGQLELVDELYSRGVKIVAVVASDGVIDCAFAGKCAAVLLTFRSGQGSARAVLDILKGLATPSGRLPETFPVDVENEKPYTAIYRNETYYPFGYGLSYTQFEYSNLKINERGISCTVKNVGGCDGFAVPQFYLQKANSKGIFKDKILRGFAKVYVKQKDYVRVEIPFDENTFKVFDEETGLYRIEGGEYSVFVSENYFSDKLTGTVTLAEYVFKDRYKGEIVESVKNGDETTVKFDVNQEPPEVRKAKKQLSFGLKLFVAILITLYYEGFMAALAFTDVVVGKDLIFYCVIGALAAIFLALFIAYVCVIAKKRKKQHYVPVNDVLTDLIENVKEFDEISKVTYAEPVKEELDEEDDFPVMQAEEVQKEKSYDLSLSGDEEEVDLAAQITFSEICDNFQAFVKSRGVVVDVTSVRALFAAIGASKIVFVTTKNTDVLPDFLSALNGYFNSRDLTVAGDGWQEVNDLLWKQQDDKFVMSDFANTVYAATKSPDKLYGAVISGVTSDLSGWFAPFINYANHPTEVHNLKLNEELTLRLPDNIRYILAPKEDGTKFPRDIADASITLDLVLSKCDAGEAIEAEAVSVNALCDLVKDARENYFLSERMWKKLDELFETLRATDKVRLGNKNTLQLEKFTSVLLECGGDEAECLTALFLAKIVPLLKLTRTYNQDGGEKIVFGIIEKLFNEEELTKIQRSLSKAV